MIRKDIVTHDLAVYLEDFLLHLILPRTLPDDSPLTFQIILLHSVPGLFFFVIASSQIFKKGRLTGPLKSEIFNDKKSL